MAVFNFGDWMIQLGFHHSNWSVETVTVEYDGDPTKRHRVIYFGPLVFSWENAGQ